MSNLPSLVEDTYRQARRARLMGGGGLALAIAVGVFLIVLFLGLGGTIPFPFILGVSPLGDPNSVLGDVLPTIIGRLIERIGAVVVGIL